MNWLNSTEWKEFKCNEYKKIWPSPELLKNAWPYRKAKVKQELPSPPLIFQYTPFHKSQNVPQANI